MAYLDRLGQLQPVRAAYEQEYHRYCRIRRTIKAATMDEEERQRRLETLTRQIEEIDGATLHPGEEEELLSRRELARHAEKLAQHLRLVRQALYGGDGETETPGALTQLTDAMQALREAGGVSEELSRLAGRLQSALYDVQACAEEAGEAEASLNFDENEREALEDRLAAIRHVVRQYGTDEADVLDRKSVV